MLDGNDWMKAVGEDHGSLEKYVVNQIKVGAEPLLYGSSPFLYLWENDFLEEGHIVRTNIQGGYIDEHYTITSEGKLKGIEAAGGLYSGRDGIHDFKKILNLKNSENGWALCSFAQGNIQLRVAGKI
jgi:hypothetical protein